MVAESAEVRQKLGPNVYGLGGVLKAGVVAPRGGVGEGGGGVGQGRGG